MLTYGLTETQVAIRETARELAEKKIRPVREHYDITEEYPWPVVEEMRKTDLFRVYLPQEYEGLGGGVLELCLVVEELSRVCGGIALAVATCALCAIPILLFGDEEQKKRWLPALASGQRLGAFAITEPEAGSDATATQATARKEGDHYILNGNKIFCSNGGAAEIYTTFFSTNPARGPRGISCFVIEKGTPGFTFGKKEKKMGIRASPTYELVFQNCKVPEKNRLGAEGMGLIIAQETFDVARPGVAAQALGIAQGSFEEALAYARQRKQFGQPIVSFQAIQHMFADAATQIESCRTFLYQVCREMDADMRSNGKVRRPTKRWTKLSAMVKLLCSEMAMKVTTDMVQVAGGIGYMRDFPLEKFMRDAKITQIYEGTNQIQRNEIGLAILKEAAARAG